MYDLQRQEQLLRSMIDRHRIDSIRGLACVLLVSHHGIVDVVNFFKTQLPLLMEIDNMLIPVRMPLFTMLSGFVYALRPAEASNLSIFAWKKVRRIVVPFVLLTILLIGLKSIVPSTTVPVSITDLPYYLLYGYSHLWFLQAVLLLYCLAAIADVTFPKGGGPLALGLLLAGAMTNLLPLPISIPLSFNKALYLLPFFFLGVAAYRFGYLIVRFRQRVVLCSLIVATISVLLYFHRLYPSAPRGPYSLLIGLSSLLLIFSVFPKIGWLSRLGIFSYTIYLFHTIFTAIALRLCLAHPYLSNPEVVLPFCILLSLLGPVVLEATTKKKLTFLSFLIGQRNQSIPKKAIG